MIGIAKRALGNAPGEIPVKVLFVHEHAHQFCDGNTRMSVVELNDDLLRELVKRFVLLFIATKNVCDRARDEEVLLLETQHLAFKSSIIGVQNLGDTLRIYLLFHRAPVIALVEQPQVEILRRLCAPKSQRINVVALVANDKRIMRDAEDVLRVKPLDALAPLLVAMGFHTPIEAHGLREVVAWDLPRAAELQPRVTSFYLATVFYLLFEDTVLIADSVASCW